MIYTDLTKKAIKLCFEAHAGQVDKSGLPYVLHPFHLAEQMDDEDSTIVALLHDVLEDTDVTLDEIHEMGFGPVVIEALVLLTHDEELPYKSYIESIKDNPLAKKVKLADLDHNSDITRLNRKPNTKDLERLEKYKWAKAFLNDEIIEPKQEPADCKEDPVNNMTVLANPENNMLSIRLEKGQTIFMGKHNLYTCTGEPECVPFTATMHGRKGKNRKRILTLCKTCGKIFAVGGQIEKIKNWNKMNNYFYDVRYIDYSDRTVKKQLPAINPEGADKHQQSSPNNDITKDRQLGKMSRIEIKGEDFLVRTGTQYCTHHGHHLKDVRALVKILDHIGMIKIMNVPAVYCNDCKQHYILEGDYQRILEKGTPLCKVVTLETYRGLKNGTVTLNEESILHALGYNVGQKDDYSDAYRQRLLKTIIEEGVLTKNEIMSHLDYLIRRSRNADRLEEARGKWQSDREYVAKLFVERMGAVGVGSIKHTEVK